VTAGYWAAGPAGSLNTLNLNLTGYPSWTYNPEGEGRISAVTASSGQNPAPPQTPPAGNTTNTSYNVFGLPNGVTLGGVTAASGDTDTFTYDLNTGRLKSYQASLGVSPSVSLTVNGPQSGATYFDTDGFTVKVTGAPSTPVYVNQNNGGNFLVGNTLTDGTLTVPGTWTSANVGTYTQVWSVGSTPATPTLNFSVVSTQPTPAGPTTSVLGPSSSGTLTWNTNGSLAQLDALDGFNSTSAQKFGNSQSCAYTHDDLGRLGTVDCGNSTGNTGKWGQSFTYGSDNFGNITWSHLNNHTGSDFQPTGGYVTSTNHFLSIGSYDGNGNLLSDGAHTYTWDANGNLYQIDGGTAMVYDALDRRVKQPNGSVILYGPDGSKLAVMSGQTVTKAFIPLPGGATAVYQGTTLAWYRHADWLGSSRLASTPTTRTVYYDGAYSPFGETIGETGTADRSFTRQNQDLGATDEYDFMYRQYHATQGRWIQPDPGGMASVDPANPQTWNRYAYVHNSPLANVDPDGQGIFADILGIVLAPWLGPGGL
jgi:RHS repeat-associated protein